MYFGDRVVSIVNLIVNVVVGVVVPSIDNSAIGRVHKAAPPWY